MCFQRNISLLLGRMKARRRAGDSGLEALVGDGQAATAPRCGGETMAAQRGEGSCTPCCPNRVYYLPNMQPNGGGTRLDKRAAACPLA
jgi:hypothetical protein